VPADDLVAAIFENPGRVRIAARFEIDPVVLKMDARRLHGIGQRHLPIEHITEHLHNRAAQPTRAAAAEHDVTNTVGRMLEALERAVGA